MQETVNDYFRRGFLLTPDALEFLSKTSDDFDVVSGDFVIDARNFVLKDRIKVIKNFQSRKSEITTEDFVKFYTSKYEKMKGVILARIQKDFISLNKIDSMRNDACIIGIVREIKEDEGRKILDVEDMTTNVPVIFEPKDAEGVEIDDVVAMRVVTGGKVLFGKEVLFPDIPIRTPAKGRGKACFVSDLHLDEAPESDADRFFSWFERSDIKNLFVAGDIGAPAELEKFAKRMPSKNFYACPGERDSEGCPQMPLDFREKNIVSVSNPAMIEINGIKVLMMHKAPHDMLKKRHMGRPSAIIPEDFMVIEEVPDIVHIGHSHVPGITNYKSVTIVNSGSIMSDFRPVVVDFSSRVAEFAKVE
ncbi:MAG: metallophosphoesterase family protein [Candidatus Aenigmarchaeota archaeon]|nr:metallophosphoesterase family protein [Candidatus Aenigmarchaeota archaeon]